MQPPGANRMLVVPLILHVYSSLRGGGIFKDAHKGASGILAESPGSRLETLLTKADVYVVVIVVVSALICALSAVVAAVSRGEADAPLACWLIAISGLLCRSALPLSGTSGAAFTVVTVGKRLRNCIIGLADEPSPVIEVVCSKCEWKGALSPAELLAIYGAEWPPIRHAGAIARGRTKGPKKQISGMNEQIPGKGLCD